MITTISAHIHEFLFIALSIFFVLAVLRFFLPKVTSISFPVLLKALAWLWVVYGGMLTFLQYRVWQVDPSMKTFLSLPLNTSVPFPLWLEWARGLFMHSGGAYVFYSIGHFWISIALLFLFSSLSSIVFWGVARLFPGRVTKDDLVLIPTALLIAGWPKVVFVIPFALIFMVPIVGWFAFRKQSTPTSLLGLSFLFATLILLAGEPALRGLHLYTLLKI